jgi:DNA processing protein
MRAADAGAMRHDPILLDSPIHTLTSGDPDWPAGLDRLGELSIRLRVAGQLPVRPGVAIVGTRAADPEGCAFTHRLAAELVEAGEWIVSGGALGVDAAAHTGALDAGGASVAVLGTGLAHAYPPRHGELFARLARTGALVTEAADGVAPHPGLFLARNRLVAALAWAVVVVQAPLRSGALSTAAWANSMQIPVVSVPGSPWDPRAGGCLRLLAEGSLICTCARDVLSLRPPGPRPALPVPPVETEKSCNHPQMDVEVRWVAEALGRRATHPDELAEQLDLPVPRVQAALLQGELAGDVIQTWDGRYHRS